MVLLKQFEPPLTTAQAGDPVRVGHADVAGAGMRSKVASSAPLSKFPKARSAAPTHAGHTTSLAVVAAAVPAAVSSPSTTIPATAAVLPHIESPLGSSL